MYTSKLNRWTPKTLWKFVTVLGAFLPIFNIDQVHSNSNAHSGKIRVLKPLARSARQERKSTSEVVEYFLDASAARHTMTQGGGEYISGNRSVISGELANGVPMKSIPPNWNPANNHSPTKKQLQYNAETTKTKRKTLKT